MASKQAPYSIRVRKFKTNPLLERKQFAMEVLHPDSQNIPRMELRDKLAKIYKVPNPNCIILFGFRTTFGGGRSKGFGLIYDNIAACEKYEKNFRLVRFGIAPAKKDKPGHVNRRLKKDIKNRQKKVRGKEKTKIAGSSSK